MVLWKQSGMTYIRYSNLAAQFVRSCLKEPQRTQAMNRGKSTVAIQYWADGKIQKQVVGNPDQ